MAGDIISLQRTATHCNALQHTATHCNTLQHTGKYYHGVEPLHELHVQAEYVAK